MKIQMWTKTFWLDKGGTVYGYLKGFNVPMLKISYGPLCHAGIIQIFHIALSGINFQG